MTHQFRTDWYPLSELKEELAKVVKELALCCPICNATSPRACASTTQNKETIDSCHWMPLPWTEFETVRWRTRCVERGEEIADDLRANG